VATILMAGTVVGLPAAADADPGSDLIPIQWDGPTTTLTWNGSEATLAGGTIVATSVSVPGDRVQRTATVANGGPSPAWVTVEIANVTTSNHDDTVNTDLEDLIHLFWNINGATGDVVWHDARLAGADDTVSYVTSFRVERGAAFLITAGYYFPAGSTDGRNLGVSSSLLQFDIQILMSGASPVMAPTGGRVV
jgi:hypothetical protein